MFDQPQNKNISKRIISAGLIIYRLTPNNIRFLLLYRGRGAWDMPRGRMEAEERSLQTAFREVYEETGLSRRDLILDKNFNRLYEKFPYSNGEEKFFKIVIFYLAQTNKSKVILSSEHEGYAWFTLAEAQRHIGRFRKRKEILRRAWVYIKSKTDKEQPKLLNK